MMQMTEKQKTALVLGAGGFIGNHMVSRLKSEGYWIRAVDLKYPEFSLSEADEFIIGDLRDKLFVERVVQFKGYLGNFYHFVPSRFITGFDEIYQYAADMGGAGYIFTGEHDADVMHNSATINLNVLDSIRKLNDMTGENRTKVLYSGSACCYSQDLQTDPNNPGLKESDAYPANPDSCYGKEKLFSESLYEAYYRNYGIPVRITRFHNIAGPLSTWTGGKEKAPAAICRKVAELPPEGGEIEVWGDGEQTRSFLYVDECIEATRRLMESDFMGPVNIGSEEMVSINELVAITAKVANKKVTIKHIDGPVGVRGRNSNNDLIKEKLGWNYTMTLEEGIAKLYKWVEEQVNAAN